MKTSSIARLALSTSTRASRRHLGTTSPVYPSFQPQQHSIAARHTSYQSLSRNASVSSIRMASGAANTPAAKTVEEPVVVFESHLASRTFKLNRPRPLHALNEEMVVSLREKLKAWKDSDLCKVIIGTSTTEKGFCAGGDVKSVVQMAQKGDIQVALDFFKAENSLDYELAKVGKPYVAVMNGITMGGGSGLSYPAPLRIATPTSEWAMPETKIGFAPDVGSQFYLAQLDGFIGAWLGITGQSIYGRALYELGVATHYIPQRSLEAAVRAVQEMEEPTLPRLANLLNTFSAPPPSEEALGQTSNAGSRDSPSPIRGAIRQLLDEAFGKPTVREIMKTLARAAKDESSSPKVAQWAKDQLKIMSERSPTGMKVALINYRQAREERNLQIQLNRDLAMCTGFLTESNSKDMFSGVTHVLVTKGAKAPMTWNVPQELTAGPIPERDPSLPEPPKWQPDTLDDPSISEDKVARNWFDRERSSILKVAPVLEGFDARSGAGLLTSMRVDPLWGKYREWGLPSEAVVKSFVEGSAKSSDAFALTEEQLHARLLDSLCERLETDLSSMNGGLKAEIKEKVKEIVDRKCEVVREGGKGPGYLRWKSKAKISSRL